jgi:hypothetical protein
MVKCGTRPGHCDRPRHALEREKPFNRAFFGTAKAAEDHKLTPLLVVTAKMDDESIVCGSVEGPLILREIECLEGQLPTGQRNPR